MEFKIYRNWNQDIEKAIELDGLFFDHPWPKDLWLSEINGGQSLLIVAENGERVAGFALFHVSIEDHFAHLFKILTHPDSRKQGVGMKLFEKAKESLNELDVTKIFLEVADDNHAAVELYRKLNFNQIHLKKNFYSDGRSALIMELLI